MRVNEGEVLQPFSKMVTQDQIEHYARVSGDFNPLHVDHEFAAASRFRGTIAHGMLVAASLSELMTASFQDNWLSGGKLKLRFRAPVYPGDVLTVSGQIKGVVPDGATHRVVCALEVTRPTGEIAITADATLSVLGEGGTRL